MISSSFLVDPSSEAAAPAKRQPSLLRQFRGSYSKRKRDAMFMQRSENVSSIGAFRLPKRGASGLAMLVAVLASATLSAAPSAREIVIGSDGKLKGLADGWAWVFPGAGATIATPNPCDNSGCFKNTGGQLCTKGNIQALTCTGQGTPQYRCNWDTNWGMVLGFNTHAPRGPWGDAAPVRIGVNYSSVANAGSAGHFRLNAHVAGDPESRQYCVDNYTPGALVKASDMKTQCWFNAGETLGSFKPVDTIGLVRLSENTSVNFDFCVTAISAE
jgi:hypothetical protein